MLHLTKLYREPFGLAPVEAMACGCPVIAWDRGAMRETIKHGETGFVVRSMEEVVELIRSGAVHSIKRERCREWAQQFSVSNMVARVEELCVEATTTGGW
jgi:glycosyltransferase involved in cell wall biosynthesis